MWHPAGATLIIKRVAEECVAKDSQIMEGVLPPSARACWGCSVGVGGFPRAMLNRANQ